MLNSIVRFAVRFRGVVIALACVVAGYGLWTVFHTRLDVFPEFAPPIITIETSAPGLSPKQVEALVTQPLEDALNGAGGLRNLRSQSIQGLSYLTLTFASSSNIYRDRQTVSERLGAAAAVLPVGVKPPVMLPLISATKLVAIIGLTSRTRSLMYLRTLADWVLKPQLLSVPGVAGMAIFSKDKQQLQIQVHAHALVRYGLSLNDIVRAARRATGVRGGGFIETRNQYILLAPHGQAVTPAELAQVVLRHAHGETLHLGNVARVRYAPAPPIGAAMIDGKPGVMIKIAMQYGANTVTVTRAVNQRLKQLTPALVKDGVQVYPDLFEPASFVHTALGNIERSLAIGAVLVVTVLFLFLFNARTTVISVVAIPLSLLTAVIFLNWLGDGINIMTLAGLAIALGEVVDDAIIDVENIFRRLRENRTRSVPHPLLRVVFDASLEVRSAVVYATFTVVLIFFPVLTLTGVTGRLFSPLALAYITAILASLLVALTVTPALCCVLLAHQPLDKQEPRYLRWLKRHYQNWLAGIGKHASAVMPAAVVLCVAALAALPFFKGQYLPEMREGHFIVHMQLDPGASLDEGLRMGNRVTAAIASVPGVESVAQRVGRANLLSGPAPSYKSEIQVNLKKSLSGNAQARILKQFDSLLRGFSGAKFTVNTFLTERIHETLSGYYAPVVVNIFGNSLATLDRAAQQTAGILSKIHGARDVQVQAPQGSPQLAIRLRERALARWGIAPVAALDAIETAYQGMRVGQIYLGTRIFNVSVIFPPAARRNPMAVGSLLLKNPQGLLVPLRAVADIRLTSGRFMILHEAAQRVQTVTAYLSGRSLTGFVHEAETNLHAANLPQGTYAVFSGAAQARAQATHELLLKTAVAIAAIMMLLFLALRSMRSLLLVLVNLPFALVGGVAAVLLMGGVVSIGSLVGFVTLFGITLRNSIMLISHYKHLVQEEGMTWGPEAALRGASERLVPILMTALVTALALLPLAIGRNVPGQEIEGPMAVVILGGLITSTVLNLLILPAIALKFGRFDKITAETDLLA